MDMAAATLVSPSTVGSCYRCMSANKISAAPPPRGSSKDLYGVPLKLTKGSHFLAVQPYLHVRSKLGAVRAEYGRREGGSGDFFAGFLVGGIVFGALGYLFAPQISKSLGGEEALVRKTSRYVDDDEGIERTRKTLNEKIEQLNAAIDDVSSQLRANEGDGNQSGASAGPEAA